LESAAAPRNSWEELLAGEAMESLYCGLNHDGISFAWLPEFQSEENRPRNVLSKVSSLYPGTLLTLNKGSTTILRTPSPRERIARAIESFCEKLVEIHVIWVLVNEEILASIFPRT
jgi:hypothetical protein